MSLTIWSPGTNLAVEDNMTSGAKGRRMLWFWTSKAMKTIHMENEKQMFNKQICWDIFNNGTQIGL